MCDDKFSCYRLRVLHHPRSTSSYSFTGAAASSSSSATFCAQIVSQWLPKWNFACQWSPPHGRTSSASHQQTIETYRPFSFHMHLFKFAPPILFPISNLFHRRTWRACFFPSNSYKSSAHQKERIFVFFFFLCFCNCLRRCRSHRRCRAICA